MNDVDKKVVLSLRSAANTIIYRFSRLLQTHQRSKKDCLDKGFLFWSRWEVSEGRWGKRMGERSGGHDEAVSTLGIRVAAMYVTRVMMDVSRAQPNQL